ncbi:LemA family protein [Candidatus Peregrinibacteria bacterium]|nr:LemA family protein [Candidatus Peregrinibacteria bacterium]
MDLTNALLIGSLILVVALFWIIVGIRHLKTLTHETVLKWQLLDKDLRKRQDLVPILIEVVRKYITNKEELIEKVIAMRMKACKEYNVSLKKIEFEHDLTAAINWLFDLKKESVELKQDVYFQELKREMDHLEKRIAGGTEEYNKIVRFHNKHRKSFILLPLAALMKYKPVDIFEFEL